MKRLYLWLKNLVRLINFTRLFIVNTLFLVLVLIVIIALNIEKQPVKIAENSFLNLQLTGSIVEEKQPADFSRELSKQLAENNQTKNQEYQIDEILQVIHSAKNDSKITNIILELDGLNNAALNHLMDIGQALNEFKAAGKTVTAISDNYSQSQYLLASFADKIYLHPQGSVLLQGFSVYRLYFKEALDKLLITPHIFKVGTYKSYVEPFTQNKMSAASKLANKHWLNQLWKNYVNTIVTERKGKSVITEQSVSPTLTQLKFDLKKAKGDSALYAKQVGLVDFLKDHYSIINEFKAQAKAASHKFNEVSYDEYLSTLPPLYKNSANDKQIALIYGSGEILAGKQSTTAIGGDSFSQLLIEATENKSIKAVVIRLDTPGGSAFASEKIRQHVLALQAAGKKVVVSMGSVAASGGYWIASSADSIVAYPTTLTGSIGIFGMFASADKMLNKFGIYNDGVGTSALSTISPTRALDPELSEIMQIGIEHGYQQFLSVVAQGRNMSLLEVDKVAQGRVWTGEDALQKGLVDQLGDLQDAISQAAKLANLESYSIIEIEPKLSNKQLLMNEFFGFGIKLFSNTIQVNPALQETISSLQSQTAILTRFNDPQGRYAYCPMCQLE